VERSGTRVGIGTISAEGSLGRQRARLVAALRSRSKTGPRPRRACPGREVEVALDLTTARAGLGARKAPINYSDLDPAPFLDQRRNWDQKPGSKDRTARTGAAADNRFARCRALRRRHGASLELSYVLAGRATPLPNDMGTPRRGCQLCPTVREFVDPQRGRSIRTPIKRCSRSTVAG